MDTLLNSLSEYGLPAFVLLAIVIFGLKLLTKSASNHISDVVDGFNCSDKSPMVPNDHSARLQNVNELIYHPLFNNAQYRIVVEIPSLELCPSKPIKQKLYRDLLILNTQTTFDYCQEIAKMDGQMNNWSGEQWSVEVSKLVNKMVTKFHERAIAAEIPDVVLFKFARWNSTTLEMLYEYIAMLGSSSIYINNSARTNTFFLIVNVLLVTTIGDAERSLKELNGEVAGNLYKGMILEE